MWGFEDLCDFVTGQGNDLAAAATEAVPEIAACLVGLLRQRCGMWGMSGRGRVASGWHVSVTGKKLPRLIVKTKMTGVGEPPNRRGRCRNHSAVSIGCACCRAGIGPARLWRVHQNARHGQPYPLVRLFPANIERPIQGRPQNRTVAGCLRHSAFKKARPPGRRADRPTPRAG